MKPSRYHTEATYDEVARRYAAGENTSAIARAMKKPRTSIQYVLKVLARTGRVDYAPPMPGFEVTRVSERRDRNGNVVATSVEQRQERGDIESVPEGHVVKGVSILQGADGRTINRWLMTREGHDTKSTIEALRTAFTDVQPCAIPRQAPSLDWRDTLTLLPLPDMHIGMYAWGAETERNWDTRIAEESIGAAMEQLVALTPPSRLAVVLGGGDAMHADSNENRTARSGNALQVDGRYQKVLKTTCRLFVRIVDLALAKHEKVVVRILPGNHDEHASVAIAYFLEGWYRNEPRVEVDTDPSLFWWFRFGQTFLGATHGHAAKAKVMPQVMASRRPQDWGASVHRFVHTFHVHHASKLGGEDCGVIVETHRAPCPPDSWHWGMGYLAGRSLSAITYDRAKGEVSRSNIPVD